VEALWESAVGALWPLRPGWVPATVDGGWVAEEGGAIVGAALLSGSALAGLVVDPEHRTRGVGSALLRTAAPDTVGRGGGQWLWPGVPDNLPRAVRFFERRGWVPRETVWDFVADLGDFRPDPAVRGTPGMTYRPAGADDMAGVLHFVGTHFPYWLSHYDTTEADSVFLADAGGEIAGALRLEWPARHGPGRWSRLLGDDLGGLRAVGVARPFRGGGVGTGMVVAATEHLRRLGVGVTLIDWLVRTAFYQQAGYRPWRSYRLVEPA
jgi:GNAT superfamily N-acetyltransferase